MNSISLISAVNSSPLATPPISPEFGQSDQYDEEAMRSLLAVESQAVRVDAVSDILRRLVQTAMMKDDADMLFRLRRAGHPLSGEQCLDQHHLSCSPLLLSLQAARKRAFECLLQLHMPVDQKEINIPGAPTPLQYALRKGQWNELQTMLTSIGKWIDGGVSPVRTFEENEVFLAALSDSEAEFKPCLHRWIRSSHSNLNHPIPGHLSLLTFACQVGCSKEFIRCLVEAGANPSCPDGRSALSFDIPSLLPNVSQYLRRRCMALQLSDAPLDFVELLGRCGVPIEESEQGKRIQLVLTAVRGQGTYKKVFDVYRPGVRDADYPDLAFAKTKMHGEGDARLVRCEAHNSQRLSKYTPYVLPSFAVEYIGKSGKKIGLLMPTCSGGLNRFIRLMSTEARWRIAVELVAALAVIHALGYVHCDLKDENILLQNATVPEGGILQLIDFGTLRKVGDQVGHIQTYLPPEQCLAEKAGKTLSVSPAIDLWNLADLLYMLVIDRDGCSLLLKHRVWYEPRNHSEMGHFIDHAKAFTLAIGHAVSSIRGPMKEIMTRLASHEPNQRPSAVVVLDSLAQIARQIGFQAVVDKAEGELKRLVDLLPEVQEGEGRCALLADLARAWIGRDCHVSLQWAQQIPMSLSRDIILKQVYEAFFLDGAIEECAFCLHLLSGLEEKTERFQAFVEFLIREGKIEVAYLLVLDIKEREVQAGCFDILFRHATEELIRSMPREELFPFLLRLIQLLCSGHHSEEARRLAERIEDSAFQKQAFDMVASAPDTGMKEKNV